MRTKAQNATHEKMITLTRLWALRKLIILAIFVPEKYGETVTIDFLPKPREIKETSGPSGFTFQIGRNRHRNLRAMWRSSHPHRFLP